MNWERKAGENLLDKWLCGSKWNTRTCFCFCSIPNWKMKTSIGVWRTCFLWLFYSDLERYKDLSGSRTSLSGKMDSFRKAAKNKWSALRRAVSLERVDHGATYDNAEPRLKKSPSLQSLAKRFSFGRKEKPGSQADFSPKPKHSRWAIRICQAIGYPYFTF